MLISLISITVFISILDLPAATSLGGSGGGFPGLAVLSKEGGGPKGTGQLVKSNYLAAEGSHSSSENQINPP